MNLGIHGSVLGLQLFITYIDDLEKGSKCKLSRFAEHVDGKASSKEDTKRFQRESSRLHEWEKKLTNGE